MNYYLNLNYLKGNVYVSLNSILSANFGDLAFEIKLSLSWGFGLTQQQQ